MTTKRPIVECYIKMEMRLLFREDAAFAKPEIYKFILQLSSEFEKTQGGGISPISRSPWSIPTQMAR